MTNLLEQAICRAGAAGPLKMLAPQRSLARSLVLGAMVIGITAVGAVVLCAVVLVLHEGLH
jgi:hypothetical protein